MSNDNIGNRIKMSVKFWLCNKQNLQKKLEYLNPQYQVTKKLKESTCISTKANR